MPANSLDPVIAGQIRFELDPAIRLQSPRLIEGLRLWESVRGNRPLPARRDFDPLSIPLGLLPHVVLIDIVPQAVPRLRWRLLGTHITKALGRDKTGTWWDEIYPADVEASLGQAPRYVARERRPVRLIGTAPFEARSFMHSEALHCPLSSDGQTVDMVIGFVQFLGVDQEP
ncbi:MAG: PAS domain-containing protein [Pseudomonadota bacterium]|nr:PAS domain-containing protein [Pseudomonadota bacterium]